jgi:hypothetical protein
LKWESRPKTALLSPVLHYDPANFALISNQAKITIQNAATFGGVLWIAFADGGSHARLILGVRAVAVWIIREHLLESDAPDR